MRQAEDHAPIGRARELGALRRALDQPLASLIQVCGLPGVGKTRVVRHVLDGYPAVYHRAPPLPDPEQRSALVAAAAAALPGWSGPAPTPPSSWEEIFAALALVAPQARPLVLAVDDAHRWTQSRARFAAPLASALARTRSEGRQLHVILAAPEALPPLPGDAHPGPILKVPPLRFRAAIPFLPGGSPRRLLASYAALGGIPGRLALVDPSLSLGANLRRLVLDEAGPLADAPLALLERIFQVPTRYAAILSALAAGEGDWGVVHAGVADLTASGQAAPYLRRLEELGMVEARRSLDASPRSRSRRYRITDPFLAFWFRFVLPRRHAPPGAGDAGPTPDVRAWLHAHVGSVFPQVCRDFVAHDAVEVLGANGREVGSLWGAGYEIPVAGILTNGQAFYGAPLADASLPSDPSLAALDAAVRETRYGFGRERRLRLLFARSEPDAALLREAARRDDARVVRLEEMAGL